MPIISQFYGILIYMYREIVISGSMNYFIGRENKSSMVCLSE